LPASRKRSPAALFVRTEPSRKIALSFFDFARADFFLLKEKQFFCEAVPCERHGGGAERVGFFQEFLLK